MQGSRLCKALLALVAVSACHAFAPGATNVVMPSSAMRPIASASSSPRPLARGMQTFKRGTAAIRTLRHSSIALKTASSSSEGLDRVSSQVRNSSWLAWWAQAILSVVSAVTIFFANAVKGPAQANILSNGILLASVGLAFSFINVFWTWGYGQLVRKIASSDDPSAKVRKMRRSIKLGVIFALSGMLVTLFGAEQIVGTMVAKAITGSLFYNGAASTSAAAAGMQLQALDIFVVQANTNTMLAHLASLVNSLYITQVLPKGD